MKTSQILAAAALLAAFATPAMAQEQANVANSNGSLRPIPQSDQMFRKTIWRTIDLREKQNRPMFSDGKEITRIILDAVKRGELQAYKNDSMATTLTPQEMSKATSYEEEANVVPGDEGGGAWGSTPAVPTPRASARRTERVAVRDSRGRVTRDRRGNIIYRQVAVAAAPVIAAPSTTSIPYRIIDLYQMDIMENMIFDKKRSRMYNEIQTLTLLIPAAKNKKSVDLPIATFKYRDLVKVFRNNPQTAIWFNAQNDAQHKNLADAFELGLFSSYITKVSNVSNSRLEDVYGGARQGILAASQTSAELIEYEYSLWSF